MKSILGSLLPARGAEQKTASITKRINLALQGGGAHGAFTWGVLDQILGDEGRSLGGISGIAAGAMNAVMLAGGCCRGGREGAQQRLADFWRSLSTTANLPALQPALMERLLSSTPL